MSLTPCRECGHPTSTEALACPECGARSPAGQPLWARGGLWGCAVLFLLVVMGGMAYCSSGTSAVSPCGEDGYALAAGHIRDGIRIYYGPERSSFGTVRDVEPQHRFPNGQTTRGVLIDDGLGTPPYWVVESALTGNEAFVRCDDPAYR